MLIFQVYIIINSLYIKCSSQFCVLFTFLSNLTILPWLIMTNVIPIQCNACNVYSHHSYLAQCTIYHFSSVEAFILWKCCWVTVQYMFQHLPNVLTDCGFFYWLHERLWHFDRKYGITAVKAWNVQTCKLAVIVILFINSLVCYQSPENSVCGGWVFPSIQWAGGVCSGKHVCLGGCLPRRCIHPQTQRQTQRQTPPGPRGRHPLLQMTIEVGSMHPIGMHSCLGFVFIF